MINVNPVVNATANGNETFSSSHSYMKIKRNMNLGYCNDIDHKCTCGYRTFDRKCTSDENKCKQRKEVRIINLQEFKDTIAPKHMERLLREFKDDQEIHNSQMAVSYSDEGFACFEVIMNKPDLLILSFIGTAC